MNRALQFAFSAARDQPAGLHGDFCIGTILPANRNQVTGSPHPRFTQDEFITSISRQCDDAEFPADLVVGVIAIRVDHHHWTAFGSQGLGQQETFFSQAAQDDMPGCKSKS